MKESNAPVIGRTPFQKWLDKYQGILYLIPWIIGFVVFKAFLSNREWGQIGNNYLRGLFALAFQGFFMMVCVGIYAVLVANIQMSDNIHSALFGVMAYTVILCFSLMKTGNFARSIFNAH